jgi:hypothetical protein
MENIFTDRDNISSDFYSELNKTTGASPDYKLFIGEGGFLIDTASTWRLGTLENIEVGTTGTYRNTGNIHLKYGTFGTIAPFGTGYALGFNGTNSTIYGTVGKPNLPISLMCWVKPKHGTCVGIFDSAPRTVGALRNFEPGKFEWQGVNLSANMELTAGTWNHLAVIINSVLGTRTIKIYTNGTAGTTAVIAGNTDFGWGTRIIFGNYNEGEGVFNGTLDNILIYSGRELTGTEIWKHCYENSIEVGSLIWYSPFMEGSGTLITNEINSVKGTLSNVGWDANGLGTLPISYGTRYYSNGTYTSIVFDGGIYTEYKNFSIDFLLNEGTLIHQFRTGSTSVDCLAKDWSTIYPGINNNVVNNRFSQFRNLLSSDGTTSPYVGKFYAEAQLDISNRIITTPEISRSLERLFQETQITSIGINIDNTDGYFNPFGTGIFVVNSMYNKPIKMWKGFKYGWNGINWGTAEYIPAFTGYIDNIQLDKNGRAVLNARDNGKIFQIRTSEKVTESGLAGGTYWKGLEVGDAVKKVVEQGAGLSSVDYYIQRGIVKDHTGSRHLSIDSNYINSGTMASMTVLNNILYFTIGTNLYEWDDYASNLPKKIYSFNYPPHSSATDGTKLYFVKSPESGTAEYRNYLSSFDGTVETLLENYGTQIGTNLYGRGNVVCSGNGIYYSVHTLNWAVSGTTDGVWVNYGTPFTGTRLFFMAQPDSLQHDCSGVAVSGDYVWGFGIGTSTHPIKIWSTKTNSLSGSFVGTGRLLPYIDGDIITVTAPISVSGTSFKTFPPNIWDSENSVTLSLKPEVLGVGTVILVYENDIITGTVYTTGTNYNSLLHSFFTPMNNQMQFRSSRYYGIFGTNPYSVTTYSDEYEGHIGTFETGNSEYISDVLQNLAKDTNYIQYISEEGKFNFVNRDSGTAIKFVFGTQDILDLSSIKGDNVSSAEIINYAIWGTATGTVSYEDLPSQGTYGVQTFRYQSKYVSNGTLVSDILYSMIRGFAYPKGILTTKLRYYPVVKLFDVVGLDYAKLNLSGTKPWQVIGLSENNVNTTLTLKEV